MSRCVLLEMLVLESKEFLCIPPKRIIEMCCGWDEGVCDDDMEYEKYLEAYDQYVLLDNEYVMNKYYDNSPSVLFHEVKYWIDKGYDYKKAVINMMRDRFYCTNIPLAEPMFEHLSDDYKKKVRINEHYMDVYMFRGKIISNSYNLDIED